MENSYTKWLENEEERKDKAANDALQTKNQAFSSSNDKYVSGTNQVIDPESTELSNLEMIKDAMNGISQERTSDFAKEIVKAVYDEDNYYEAYEKVEKMLNEFLK